jgi:hypothetical protein
MGRALNRLSLSRHPGEGRGLEETRRDFSS